MKLSKFLFLFVLLFLTACQSDDTNTTSSDELLIYTSIYPMQYAIEQIAGDKATVESIYPPGVDAHSYEPSPREITTLANGDAFFYLGAGMESFAETTANALASQKISLIEIGQHEELFLHSHDQEQDHVEHNHGDKDPHIWIDPLRMIELGDIVKNELIQLSPDDEAIFTENFASFKKKMQSLDTSFTETLADKQNKHILVTHAAYGYWEERYGIEQIAINGLSSNDEPSQKELAKIAHIAKEKDIQYVIYESSTSNKVAAIVQEYIGADKLSIHNLEVLTEKDIHQGKDYLSIMRQNIQVLDKAIEDGND